MRLAAIDIGTNSIHMIIVRVRPDLSFEVIDREKEMVRLGAGGLDGKALTPSAMHAGLQALSKFKRLADSHGVDEIIAAATSATREAENGGDFLATVMHETGIRVRVISGHEEARLIHLAAVYGVDLGGGHGVVIDIGGGSVEITLGTVTSAQLAKSFKIGVIRLSERFVRTDPLVERDERRMVKYINKEIGDHVDTIVKRGFQRVIGTSGTILSLGGVVMQAETGSSVDRHPQLPRVEQGPAQAAQAARRLRSAGTAAGARPRSAPRRSRGRGLRAARYDPAPARRRRLHAVRSRAARRADPRLHPPQQDAHRHHRSVSGHPAAQRRGTGTAVQLLVGSRASGRAAGAGAVRSDADAARPRGRRNASGSNTARCSTTSACTSATRAITSTRTI